MWIKTQTGQTLVNLDQAQTIKIASKWDHSTKQRAEAIYAHMQGATKPVLLGVYSGVETAREALEDIGVALEEAHIRELEPYRMLDFQ